jgi:hypothetical protein
MVRASLKDGVVIKTTISFGKDQFPLYIVGVMKTMSSL